MKNKLSKSKLFFILASLVFVVYFFASLPYGFGGSRATEISGNWSDVENVEQIDGSIDVIEIKNEQQLAYVSTQYETFKDKKIILTNSLNFDGHYWTPIKEFNGEFDGNGFAISGLNIYATDGYAGFIGKTAGANIHNLTLNDVKIYNVEGDIYNSVTFQFAHIGFIVANIISGEIKNCTVNNTGITSINFTLSETITHLWFGGIVGRVSSSANIESCLSFGTYNFSSVYNTQNLNWASFGGVVGEAVGVSITYCCSNSHISGVTNISEVCGGGIVGKVSNSSKTTIIKESCNWGNISVGNDTKTNIAYCGGIVGHDVTEGMTIEYCYNTGEISAYGKNTKSFKALYNLDTTNYSVSTDEYIGDTTFEKGNCYGEIGIFNNIFAGGIVGCLFKNSIVNYCFNSGKTRSNSCVYIKDHLEVKYFKNNKHKQTFIGDTVYYVGGCLYGVLIGNMEKFSIIGNNYAVDCTAEQDELFHYGEANCSSRISFNALGVGLRDYEISSWCEVKGTGATSMGCSIYVVPNIPVAMPQTIGISGVDRDLSPKYSGDWSITNNSLYTRNITYNLNFLKPTSSNVNDILNVCDKFIIDDSINGGAFPVLKSLHWDNSTSSSSSIPPSVTYTYDLNEDKKEATLTGVSNSDGTSIESVEIPETVFIGGTTYTVTAIGDNAFTRNMALKEVKLPNSITTIGEGAFFRCRALEKINTDNIISYGAGSFEQCVMLTEIKFSENLKEICSAAFADCAGLTMIDLSHTEFNFTDDCAFEFFCCSNLTEIKLPNTVTRIGMMAFYECINLKSINLINVTEIQDEAFYGCKKLSEVQLSDKLETLGDYAFYGCSMYSITLYNTLKYIGYDALNCSAYFVRIFYYGTKEQWNKLNKDNKAGVPSRVFIEFIQV